MFDTFKKIYSLFEKRDKRIIKLLFAATVVMAFIQVAAIGSIMPFLTVVTNPESIENNRYLNTVYTYLGFASTNAYMIFLGFMALIILTFGNLIKLGVTLLKLRFIHIRGHMLSMRLLDNYLEKPYIFFVNQNSSNLSKEVLWEVKLILTGLLTPAAEMLSNGMVGLFIILFLFLVNPAISLLVVLVLGGTYMLIDFKVKGKLRKLGDERREANEMRFKATSEAFGAIKDIKLMNNQENYLRFYEKSSLKYERTQISQEIYSHVPNHALETIAFGGILLIVLYMLIFGENISSALPIIGLYGYSILRLQPIMKVVYASVSQIRFYQSTFYDMYDNLKIKQSQNHAANRHSLVRPLPFADKLSIENVHFRYPGAKRNVFSGLNLTIKANSSVAFVGATGSGKTTLIDVILGLLNPDIGRLSVDGVTITSENLRNWQINLGYVPQNIYLSDDTVAKNIAFGVHDQDIDRDRVKKAAKMACIHDFIKYEMPDGYDTIVGENGIRLSGGQRQRIGIARVLFRDPQILILDEATSALDNRTEESVFQAIDNISNTKTVIMIAHRLTTVQNCNTVFFIDKGKIIAAGTYEELLNTCHQFRTFSKLKTVDTEKEEIV
jgi:ATP-binding cassette, subfamily B, bacterial PglK